MAIPGDKREIPIAIKEKISYIAPVMTFSDETRRLEREIGARIDAAVKADPRVLVKIGQIGISEAALDKIRQGKSTTQFAKLAQLAAALNRTPNELLGFNTGERDILTGALQGAFEGLGEDQMRAQALADIVLGVIGTHEAGDPSPNPRERARSIAKYLVQLSVDPPPK
jgi:DNA-binding Xre family transcriptional regulator